MGDGRFVDGKTVAIATSLVLPWRSALSRGGIGGSPSVDSGTVILD